MPKLAELVSGFGGIETRPSSRRVASFRLANGRSLNERCVIQSFDAQIRKVLLLEMAPIEHRCWGLLGVPAAVPVVPGVEYNVERRRLWPKWHVVRLRGMFVARRMVWKCNALRDANDCLFWAFCPRRRVPLCAHSHPRFPPPPPRPNAAGIDREDAARWDAGAPSPSSQR